ncbi:MAG TPA: peptidoglycan-binding domain-containing protein [Gemmataceae bacterium]|nr:peptidoglycan-binding domain-containing protein [Gemmataceae bacterium]
MALLAPQWSDGNWRTKGWLRQAELNSPPLFLGQPGRYSNDPVTFAASAGAVRVFQTVYNRIAFGLPLLRLPFLPIPPGVSVPLPLPGAIRPVSGNYDGPTVTAVAALQTALGLSADGAAGQETLTAMDELLRGMNNGTINAASTPVQIIAFLMAFGLLGVP